MRIAHQPLQMQHVAVETGQRGDRHMAAAIQGTVHGALGTDTNARIGIIQRCKQRLNIGRILTTLHCNRALRRSGQPLGRFQACTDARGKAQALQPGAGQQDGLVFTGIEFCQPRIDIAAQIIDQQILAQRAQLRLAPQR